MRVRKRAGVAVLLVISAGLAGCSTLDEKAPATSLIPLEGPWAAQFQTAFAKSRSSYEKGVLRDGVVTPAEYEQTKNRLRSCLDDSGYSIAWDERGGFELGSKTGSYPDDFFERSDPVLQQCESEWTGSILYLFEQVRRNPDKKDEAGIQVACLASAGLVDASYSKQRWARDNEKDDFPFDTASKEAIRCSTDPLGLWFTE